MRAVNLLPRDGRRDRRKGTSVPVLVGAAGAVVVSAVLSMLYLNASGAVHSKQSDLDNLRAELAATPPPQAVSPTSTVLADEKKVRVTALTAALSRRVAWDRVFRELSLILPDDVWLSTLTAKSPVLSTATAAVPPAPGSPPTGFTIQGYTYSQEAVARLLARLQVVPDLTNVQLQASTATPLGKRSIVQFTILADVRGPGATS